MSNIYFTVTGLHHYYGDEYNGWASPSNTVK